MRLLSGVVVAALCSLGSISPAAADDLPQVRITSPKNGAVVQLVPGLGGTAVVEFDVDDFDIKEIDDPPRFELRNDNGDDLADEGYVRVSVDHGVSWLHTSDDPIVITGLAPGPHILSLELVGSHHEALDPPVKHTVTITVQ